VEVSVEFIDANRDELGVEPICRELQVAPSTYYAHKKRPLSARAVRDALMIPVLVALWKQNYRVYGVRKLWRAARRAGEDLGRDQVARLMSAAGIEGRRKGAKRRTTKADPAAARHPDLVERNFSVGAPNALWVSDLTYVATWAGFAYVCFITDAYSRMIVGWRVATHMRTDMVLDALEMARWRRGTILEGLISHSDAGSQFTSVRYGERLAELGAVPSIGSVGDAFDNALAESVNSSYKEELIRGPDQGPWKNVDDVELATLAWVHWFNTTRLHESLNYVPPAEFESTWRESHPLCGSQRPANDAGGSTGPRDLTLSGQL
jgi:putative transposase